MKLSRSPDNLPGGSSRPPGFLIVGIGASAGGVQALQQFFENVPIVSGMAYVVILHLLPDHESKLAEVLRIATEMPVMQVVDKVKVKPNHVYVISPNKHLVMMDGSIGVLPNLQMEDRRAPVDIFFRTLAESHGSGSVCVVLSGTGADGSMGLRRIKEMGGAAFVQNPREAEFNEMPRHSIDTNLVDEVLPVGDIPGKIIAYRNGIGVVKIPLDADSRAEEEQKALRDVFTILRVGTGHDFSHYKLDTLLRRVERRINIRSLSDFPSYTTLLRQNSDEVTALLKDLLISVTNFFRDQKAFEALDREVLRQLFLNTTQEDEVRVWVAGCATGEEAYSLAMLCAERITSIAAPKVQIFATDIDETAIAHAREGLYTLTDAADVSPERLQRFFDREGDRYRIKREIREMILFANHNFLKDPPFSHIDLISCRNVLIYLNQAAQERVMKTFHFALKPDKFLFLGSSESTEGAADLYSTVSSDHHIFRSRNVAPHSYPVPDSVPNFRFGQPPHSPTFKQTEARAVERFTFGDLHQRLLEQYAAPSIVVNEEYDIVHISEGAGRYLQIPGGDPTKSLLKLILPKLRLEMRSALYQAVQRKMAIETKGLRVVIDEHAEKIIIRVHPVLRENDAARGFLLVLFEEVADEGSGTETVFAASEPAVQQLEEELMHVKAQLRVSVEQHEFQAEELKASNEELHAMNEELRSAAEELETSKEELQSINEELRTVNQELKIRVDETTVASNNLQNLIKSLDFGTIFLDKSFRVVLFTPAVQDIFNLLPADYGRPLTDITNRLDYPHLLIDAQTVLERLQTIEREVTTTDGKAYMMRVLPYRTSEDRINGVVITFIDITRRKQAELFVLASRERLRVTVDSAVDFAIITTDDSGNIIGWNSGAERIFGYEENEIIGKSGAVIFTEEDIAAGVPLKEMTEAKTNGKAIDERWHVRKDGSRFFMSGVMAPIHDSNIPGFVRVARDLTEQKQFEENLRLSEERYRVALKSAEMGAWDWNIAENKVVWNDQHFFMLGVEPSADINPFSYFLQFIHPDDKNAVARELKSAEEITGIYQTEFRIIRPNGQIRWMHGYGRSVEWTNGKASRLVGVMYDITHRKTLEQQKDEFISIASHELKTPVTSIKSFVEVLHEILQDSEDKSKIEIVGKLDRQVDRLTNLISDLLDTSKLFEGRLELHKESFDMNALVEEYAEDLQRITQKHKLVLQTQKVGPVNADRERVGQVLTNFISNAIKYSSGGEITIRTEAEDSGVKVSVVDSGIGIADEVISKVFDRFFRVRSAQMSTYPGMGLGLYISAGIIYQHGGTVSAYSRAGNGSTFVFTLPYMV